MTRKTTVENIKALVELERYGIAYETVGPDEVLVKCPFHEDGTPSLGLNVEKNVFRCRSANCGAHGDILTLLAGFYKCERQVIREELSKYYDLEDLKELNPTIAEEWHSNIWEAGPLLKELYRRGLTDDDIRAARLGFDKDRITIPVYDMSGRLVNVRKYMPGAPGKDKMRNTKGYGEARIYQIPQTTKFDTIWICGGEMKAIVAARLLNPNGIGAICATGGEGTWHESFNQYIKGKKIYICLDVDAGGQEGSRRLAEQVFHFAGSVSIIRLPLDIEKYPKGDINDWVYSEKAGAEEFLAVQQTAKLWEPVGLEEEKSDEVAENVSLEEAIGSDRMGFRLECDAVVTAMDSTPYLVPHKVGISCTRDQPSCANCPVFVTPVDQATGYTQLTIKGISKGMLDMVGCVKSQMNNATREALRIPPCKVAQFHINSYRNVIDLRIAPLLKAASESSENIQPVQALAVDCPSLEINSPYRFSGRVYPHPKNQQAVLVFDQAISGDDNLTNFTPNQEEIQWLSAFQPKEWTTVGLEEKLGEIYDDFESNVTRIFNRKDLHLTVDLCYHSVLFFKFDNRVINGWTNILIVGDSSQGKSEASSKMREHYQLGEKVEGKNTSIAGILGGVQQMSNRWFVSWGAIPKNDRRLVMIEELKGMGTEVVAALTDMRSSGMAEITKIETRRAHARTRLIAISNPRENKPVSQYTFGVQIIKELIGHLEDIRRFDFAAIIATSQVSSEDINLLSSERPQREHRFDKNLCRKLILWGWSRRMEQTAFEDSAIRKILQGSTQLCKKFDEAIPLCDKGSMSKKVARLAAALAVRTFSTLDGDPGVVLVRECHVQYILDFLDRTYSSDVFGYREYSESQANAYRMKDHAEVEKKILDQRHAKDFVDQLIARDEITGTDIADWCEIDRDSAQNILSLLVRKKALLRNKFTYEKTSEFISFLKGLMSKISSTGDGPISVDHTGDEF